MPSEIRELEAGSGVRWTAPVIAGIYGVVSIAWILLSDQLAEAVSVDQPQLERLQTIKGVAFVIMTAVMLYVLTRAGFGQVRSFHGRVAREQARLRQMLDAAPVFIWTAGPDMQCKYFNTGWLNFRGRTLEQEIGSGWKEGVHPDDLAGCLNAFEG